MTIGPDILIYLGIFSGLYFSIFILGTFFEKKEEVYKKIKESYSPSVCLIVPCYNEENNIKETISSLLLLDYPKEKLEIIVVDDGSTDNTFKKAKAFEKYGVKVIHKENGGKHTALNIGIKQTDAEFIGSVDADCSLKPDSLKNLIRHFIEPEVMAVTSTVKINKAENTIEGIQYVEFLVAAFLKKIYSVLDSLFVTPGPLSVFRREVFEKLGPYHKAHQTEDLELGFRLQKANFKIAHAVNSIVYTKPCPTVKSLLLQRLRWRRGFLLNLKEYTELLNIRKHGNLTFLLFFNLLGSTLSIGVLFYAIWRLNEFLFQKINSLVLTGIHTPSLSANIDLFSFNLKPTLILGTISTGVFIIYLVFSKKLTSDSKPIKKETVFYVLFYSLLNAVFFITAIFSAVFKKKVYWK